MIYAFMIPLWGGVLPHMLPLLKGKAVKHAKGAAAFWHAAIATLTVGSLMTGVLEIYGTTNRLVDLYWYVGSLLVILSFISWITRVVLQKKSLK